MGVDWRSEEEEKRNAVTRFPAGVADLVLGGRMALKGGQLDSDSRAADLAVCNCKKS